MPKSNRDHLILVVDDDVALLGALKELLEGEGLSVLTAKDGLSALNLLLLPQCELPTVILMDLLMPVMNGYEFRAKQLEHEGLGAIPVIFLSGLAIDPTVSDRLVGCTVLKKPIDLEPFLITLKGLMMDQP